MFESLKKNWNRNLEIISVIFVISFNLTTPRNLVFLVVVIAIGVKILNFIYLIYQNNKLPYLMR